MITMSVGGFVICLVAAANIGVGLYALLIFLLNGGCGR